jgi:hypothetical protein
VPEPFVHELGVRVGSLEPRVDEVWSWLTTGTEPDFAAAIRFNVATHDRRRDALALFLRGTVSPTAHEWSSLPLPLPLLSAYRLVRLAWKHGPGRER